MDADRPGVISRDHASATGSTYGVVSKGVKESATFLRKLIKVGRSPVVVSATSDLEAHVFALQENNIGRFLHGR